uniref:[RNA-polymerase]-subunit kinase n=1 Tax=Aegilops tauschii subsp. strangulata TaxID=200361 RepID=A0A453K629_AEGTS
MGPPELLLGSTEYSVAVDMWSTGCIVAELFAGKPIMPGRTEVEQIHKIFKLCGSPMDDYCKKSKNQKFVEQLPQLFRVIFLKQSHLLVTLQVYRNFQQARSMMLDSGKRKRGGKERQLLVDEELNVPIQEMKIM